jgi:nicotinate-nucleotide adenylyltransferase
MTWSRTARRRPHVAFFGGSFDPPHLGHLAVARAAREALRLDSVLFAPVGTQPLKPHGSTAPFKDRLRMTKLAIQGERGFEVSKIDAPNPAGQPNYTLETLSRLRESLRRDRLAMLFCLMGADSFLTLHQWHRASEIPFAATLIVASRPGQSLADLTSALPSGLTMQPQGAERETRHGVKLQSFILHDASGRKTALHLLPGLDIEISASQIRRQIRSETGDAAERELLSPAVANYIRRHGLYR